MGPNSVYSIYSIAAFQEKNHNRQTPHRALTQQCFLAEKKKENLKTPDMPISESWIMMLRSWIVKLENHLHNSCDEEYINRKLEASAAQWVRSKNAQTHSRTFVCIHKPSRLSFVFTRFSSSTFPVRGGCVLCVVCFWIICDVRLFAGANCDAFVCTILLYIRHIHVSRNVRIKHTTSQITPFQMSLIWLCHNHNIMCRIPT